MKTDNAAFVQRHQHPHTAPAAAKPRRRVFFPALILIILYFSLCVLLALYMNVEREAVMIAAGSFIAAAILAFLLLRIFHKRSNREKESQLLREVLEGSRGARLITDAQNRTLYANLKFKNIFPYEGDNAMQSLIAAFNTDSEAATQFRILADQAHRGLTDTVELSSTLNGHEYWYQITAQPIAGYAGYIHWRIDDITQKRTIDRAIREEREKLIDFTDNAPVGFFSVDEQGRFVFVNATLARWLGEDIQNLLSIGRLHNYFQDVPAQARPYDLVADGGAKQMAEIVMKGPAGKTFIASLNQAVVHEGNGIVRTRGVVHDLTAERAMRQALKASEDKFQRFFEEAPLGIGLIDSQGVINDCNPTLAAMLGYHVEELEGKHFESLIDPADREAAHSAMQRIDQGRQMRSPMEVTLKGRENDITVQMHGRKLGGSDNIVLHFIDLSQQKALELQFVQSQKMQAIGQLAGGIAHDFNNLLTAIIGFCDLLLLRHKAGDPSFADIMQIKQNSNRAANLVRQLLAFSRQQTLRPQVQDLTDILTEISHLLRRLIGANIELDVVHGPDLGLVKVDAGQMEQVLINLAVNARDAMENGGRLIVKTGMFANKEPLKRGDDEMPPGEWVTLTVTDSGFGIPHEIMTRIFEPFFTTKEVGQGTGLGLATVYGIIRQTGGYLHVESIINQGTSFIIYLPRAAEEEETTTAHETNVEDETRDLTGTARILLVEDEDAVRTFSSRALMNKGYEVLDDESGEAALNVIQSKPDWKLDLLITDVIMPNMDGPTLAQRMRQINPNMKIIFISGYTEEKLKDHMGENIWFLPKPFTLKQLAAKVKEALEE